ncbi:MAG: hypothetical protein ACE5EM_12440 [Sphingomonadales bacterium]
MSQKRAVLVRWVAVMVTCPRCNCAIRTPRRLPAETFALVIEPGLAIDVSLARIGETGALHEIVFVGRGKIGGGLDLMLHDLGVQLSRAIQGRDPVSGDER